MDRSEVHLKMFRSDELRYGLMLHGIPIDSTTVEDAIQRADDHDFVVCPKSTSTRLLLSWEKGAEGFKLRKQFSPNVEEVKLGGCYIGDDYRAFTLDVEILKLDEASPIILAFDIVDLAAENWHSNHLLDYGCKYHMALYTRRYAKLISLVRQISGLSVSAQQIEPPEESCRMWNSQWNAAGLPYQIAGLVFLPNAREEIMSIEDVDNYRISTDRVYIPFLKWRPQQSLATINVALGEGYEKGETHSLFEACFLDQSCIFQTQTTDVENISDRDSFPYRRREEKGANFHAMGGHKVPRTKWGDETQQVIEEDLRASLNERKKESMSWEGKRSTCDDRVCCCGEKTPNHDRVLMHCSECGAIGASEDGEDFRCRLECHKRKGKTYNISIPNECVDEAKQAGFVEVSVNMNQKDSTCLQLFFERVSRKRLAVASTYKAASQIGIDRALLKIFGFEEGRRDSYPRCLLDDSLPNLVEHIILLFLPILDLVRCRQLSKTWRLAIDDLDIQHSVREKYFQGDKKTVRYYAPSTATDLYYVAPGPGSYRTPNSNEGGLSPRSLVQFFRFGGSVEPLYQTKQGVLRLPLISILPLYHQ